MAVDHVRSLILNTIEKESLAGFMKACATTDKLFEVMERTNDRDEAYATCVAWCTSVLELARIESRLLSSVLPLFEEELEDIMAKVHPLIQQRTDAREAVREFRGPDHDVRPLSMKVDPRRAAQIRKARKHSKQVSMEVLEKLKPIEAELEPLRRDIGAIKRSLRVLAQFVQHHFPIPARKATLRGQSSVPSGEDPIEAYSRKYADNLDNRDAVDERRVALERLRAHPTNRYDRFGQEQAH